MPLTDKQYLVRVWWPTVKIIGNVSLVQRLKRVVYHGRFYAIEPTAHVGEGSGGRERREGEWREVEEGRGGRELEKGRGGREVEEGRWREGGRGREVEGGR